MKKLLSLTLALLIALTSLPVNYLTVLAEPADAAEVTAEPESPAQDPAAEAEPAAPAESPEEAGPVSDPAEPSAPQSDAAELPTAPGDAAETPAPAEEALGGDDAGLPAPDQSAPQSDEAVTGPAAADATDGAEESALTEEPAPSPLNSDTYGLHFGEDYDPYDFPFFSDEVREIPIVVDAPEGSTYQIAVTIGMKNPRDSSQWIATFMNDPVDPDPPFYAYSDGTLTLYGQKCWAGLAEALDGMDYEPCLDFEVCLVADGASVSRIDGFLFMSEPYCDIREEGDQTMLLNETRFVSNMYQAYAESGTTYKGGQNVSVTVKDVVIDSQSPASGEGDVLEVTRIERQQGDARPQPYWWDYKAVGYGSAVLKVFWTDVFENDREYTFNVTVAEDVYGVHIEAEHGQDRFLPGESERFFARTEHCSLIEERDGNLDGMDWEWHLEDDFNNSFVLTRDSDHHDIATVTLREDAFSSGVVYANPDVVVDVYYDGSVIASDSFRIIGDITYTDIMPRLLDPDLMVGESQTASFCAGSFPATGTNVYNYPCDPLDVNAHFIWDYDPDVLEIIDTATYYEVSGEPWGHYIPADLDDYINSPASWGSVKEFKIKRWDSYETTARLRIEWEENGVPRSEEREYHFNRVPDPGVVFEYDTDKLYSDSDLQVRVGFENVPDSIISADNLYWHAGVTNAPNQWDLDFVEGTDYTFDPATLTFTFHGDKIAEKLNDDLGNWFSLLVGLMDEDKIYLACTDLRDFELREPWTSYELPFDRSMLPGWGDAIDCVGHGRYESAEAPDGEDFDFEVTNVEVIENHPWEEGLRVVDLHRDSDENDPSHVWWYYEARNFGEAKIRISFKGRGGEAKTWDFNISVGRDVYEVNLVTGSGSDMALPGSTVDLYALTRRESLDDNSLDGITYEFSLTENGNDFAELVSVENEPFHKKLVFRDPLEGEDWIDGHVNVEVRIFDGEDESGQPVERGRSDCRIHVCSEYPDVWPAHLDDMHVGLPYDIPFELRYYSQEAGNDSDYTVVENAHFRWYYDDSKIKVFDSGNNPVGNNDDQDHYIETGNLSYGEPLFRFRRISGDDTNLHLEVDWTDGGGNPRHESRDYWLGRIDTNIWFDDGGNNRLYSDGTKTVILNMEALGDQPHNVPVFGIGYFLGDPENEDNFVDLSGEPYCTVTDEPATNPKKRTIVLDGEKIWERAHADGVDRIFLHTDIDTDLGDDDPDNDIWLASADHQLELREARRDLELPDDDCMLRGWEWQIDRWAHIYVEDSAHPDGYDDDVEIISVTSSDESIVSVRQEFENDDENSGNYWWKYLARQYGDADITLTYKLPEELGGEVDTHTFRIHVDRDVYNVWVHTDTGADKGLPGETMTLVAEASHERNYDGDEDDFSYQWSFTEERFNELATLTQDPDHPFVSHVRFRDLNPGEEGIWEDIEVEVTVFEGTDEETGDPIERCRNRIRLVMADDYIELNPTDLDELLVGEETTVTAELLQKCLGEEPKQIDTFFRWYYNEDVIKIYDSDGKLVGNNQRDQNGDPILEDGHEVYNGSEASAGKACEFTIRRVGPGSTDIHFCADWNDHGEFRSEESHFRIDDLHYDIWFDDFGDGRIFSDGTKTVALRMEDLADLNYILDVFQIGFEEGERFTELTGCYQVRTTDEGKEIIFDGAAVAAAMAGKDTDTIILRAEAGLNVFGSYRWMAGTEHRIKLCESFIDYHEEGDTDLLRHWDRRIDHWQRGYVENAAHPDGDDFDYEVLNVEIVDSRPQISGRRVVEVREEYDDEDDPDSDLSFRYEALNLGEADLKVTYKIPDEFGGGTGSYTFTVRVSEDVYWVDVWSETGSYMARPGDLVELEAQGRHEGDESSSTEGFLYEWKLLEDGNEYADISAEYEDHPEWADVIFRELEDGEEGIWKDIRVSVTLYKLDENNERHDLARNEITLTLADSYAELLPTGIDSRLDVGVYEPVTAQIREYSMQTPDGFSTPEAHFRWYYDPEAVEIFDANRNLVGNNDNQGQYKDSEASYGVAPLFVIRRLEPWDTDIFLEADWEDEYGNDRHIGRVYHLDRKNYDIRLISDCDRVFNDPGSKLEYRFEMDDLSGKDGTDFNTFLNLVGWNDDVSIPLIEREDYTFDRTNMTITLDGYSIGCKGARFVSIYYSITSGDDYTEIPIKTDVVDCEVRDPIYDFDNDREYDRDMIPGQTGRVNSVYHIFVENQQFPYGEDVPYTVYDVSVDDEDPYSGSSDVLSDPVYHNEEGDDPYWSFEAVGLGYGRIKVSYDIPEVFGGGKSDFTFSAWVKDEAFSVEIEPENGVTAVYPGQSVNLTANGSMEKTDASTAEETYHYAWVIEDRGCCSIEWDPDGDTSKAKVIFDEQPDEDDFHEDIPVQVIMYHDWPTGYFDEVARDMIWLHVELPMELEVRNLSEPEDFEATNAVLDNVMEKLLLTVKGSYDKFYAGTANEAHAAELNLAAGEEVSVTFEDLSYDPLAGGVTAPIPIDAFDDEGHANVALRDEDGVWHNVELHLYIGRRMLEVGLNDADFTAFNEAWDEANSIDRELYTEESLKGLDQLLEFLDYIIVGLPSEYQDDVDEAAQMILDTIGQLVYKEVNFSVISHVLGFIPADEPAKVMITENKGGGKYTIQAKLPMSGANKYHEMAVLQDSSLILCPADSEGRFQITLTIEDGKPVTVLLRCGTFEGEPEGDDDDAPVETQQEVPMTVDFTNKTITVGEVLEYTVISNISGFPVSGKAGVVIKTDPDKAAHPLYQADVRLRMTSAAYSQFSYTMPGISEHDVTLNSENRFDFSFPLQGSTGPFTLTGSFTNASTGKTETHPVVIDIAKKTITIGDKKVEATRIAGGNRATTSLAVAEQLKKLNGGKKFNAVVLAVGEDYADALAGGYLAQVKGAPILLLRGKKEADRTKVINYVKSNLNKNGTVYVLGSTAAIPDSWIKPLKSSFKNIKRLGGKNRFGTNAMILKEIGTANAKEIIAVNGRDFPDALCASAVEMPLLTLETKAGKDKVLTGDQIKFLADAKKKHGSLKIYMVGKKSLISAYEKQLKTYGTVTWISSSSDVATRSVAIANKFFSNPDTVALARIDDPADGLGGGVLAAKLKAPLLLTNVNSAPSGVVNYVSSKGIRKGLVYGSTAAVADKTVKAILKNATIIKIEYK